MKNAATLRGCCAINGIIDVYKRQALSFMLDIFAGVLSDGNTVSGVGRLSGDEHGVSQVFIAVDYRNLVTQEAAERIVEGAVKDLLASGKAQGTDRIIDVYKRQAPVLPV